MTLLSALKFLLPLSYAINKYVRIFMLQQNFLNKMLKNTTATFTTVIFKDVNHAYGPTKGLFSHIAILGPTFHFIGIWKSC